MANELNNLIERTKDAVRYWWVLLLVGIIFFVVGVIVFFYPGESYLVLSVLFGVSMLISGIAQLVLAIADRNYFTGRGWMIVSGIIEVILGIILCANIGISAATLPFLLAFWFMYRGFLTIGLGSDMADYRIKGSAWTIVLGVLLLILSIVILLRPLFGFSMIVALLGVTFLLLGVTSCYIAFQVKNAHNYLNK